MSENPRPTPAAVLIVEDEDSIRDSLTELFEVEHVHVMSAADTRSALAALYDREFDLVVTDLRLGGKHDAGLQVMAAATMLSPDAAVIALTAYPNEATRHAAHRLGATHFIEKPADLLVIASIAARHGVPSAIAPHLS
ncbi:MAG: response regulator [Gemmatimonadaceae bacterium]|nr:response regulator [Gemmatimonadaceae bacterium]NUQ92267.1 response regulator [Gemmatimonadaceae bacterium]NUR18859.1 response regulator [Gemmatimonadaceae bacterium]NUS98496.1 response regulator [Gemmatimonadaceae bacterium]